MFFDWPAHVELTLTVPICGPKCKRVMLPAVDSANQGHDPVIVMANGSFNLSFSVPFAVLTLFNCFGIPNLDIWRQRYSVCQIGYEPVSVANVQLQAEGVASACISEGVCAMVDSFYWILLG